MALDLEIRLARASLTKTEMKDRNRLDNPFRLTDYPKLGGHPPSWTEYISDLLGIEITEEEVVTVYDTEYLKVHLPHFLQFAF